jgi:hypothetical protein
MAANGPGSVAFVDIEYMDQIERRTLTAPVIAVKNNGPVEALRRTIKAFERFPWLSHVVQTSMLALPQAQEHLDLLVERLKTGRQQLMLSANGVGRVALLNQASHRTPRFERMREFFEARGASDRMLTVINDVAEELVMNALFNAPVESGYLDHPRSRIEDLELPPDRACEISYGVDGTSAFIRVRVTFGSL